MRLVGPSSLLALFLAGLAGCGSGVTLVDGIPADAAAAADVGGDDDAADDAAALDAPGEDGDQDGGINDNDGGGVNCGVVDGDTGPPDGACSID